MAAIEAVIVGKDALLAKYRQRAATITPKLYKAMLLQMARVAEYSRANKLSGQVLRTRTGTLRRSVAPKANIDNEGNPVGKITTNVPYARIHEYGGTFAIPSHSREITMAFGRPIAPVTVVVRAHSVKFPERSFLRTALAEKKDEVFAALRGVVIQELQK